MSRPVSPIFCDGPSCGKQKHESNHWWTLGVSRTKQSIVIVAGTVELTRTDDGDWVSFDACGQECALKIWSEQMGRVTL
jgi:hypothetical protein